MTTWLAGKVDTATCVAALAIRRHGGSNAEPSRTAQRRTLATDPHGELEELAGIYRRRGLPPALAMQVAEHLSEGANRLDVHLRAELGLQPENLAQPLQAAAVSAASFGTLAALPIVALLAAPASLRIEAIAAVSLASLAVLGAPGGWLGGAPVLRASVRVVLGGGAAMAATAAIGHWPGVAGAG